MNTLIAFVLYTVIVFSFLQNWLWLSVVALLMFSYRYSVMILIPTAIIIDGYFGNYYSVPFLSVCSVFWFLIVTYARPKMTGFNVDRMYE